MKIQDIVDDLNEKMQTVDYIDKFVQTKLDQH